MNAQPPEAQCRHRRPVVWRLSDGKRGHDVQSLGLCEALSRRIPGLCQQTIELTTSGHLTAWLRGRFPAGDTLDDPDLIIGAGHRTHGAMLAARRSRGGRTVVLMRPTLPLALFDLALIPAHDQPPARDRVLATEGSINRMRPASARAPLRLILIGGPSRHGEWSESLLLEQLKALDTPPLQRIYATSRRTPQPFVERLLSAGIEPVQWQDVDADWLARTLPAVEQAWVTEDSVNMVYESLTAGVAVGLIATGSRGRDKLSTNLERLEQRGWVTRWHAYRNGAPLTPPATPLAEADRCADWIARRWLNVH